MITDSIPTNHRFGSIVTATQDDPYRLASVVDDTMVGYISGGPRKLPKEGIYLGVVAVDDARRGQGHGYELVAEFLRRVLADGHETVYLVRPNNAGRVFEGGFGFVEDPDDQGRGLTLFVASPPDPEWVSPRQ